MPIVIASFGTYCSPKKSAAASRRVTLSRCTRRVRLFTPEPGSLKPMCPVLPMPRSWKSMPPAARIAASYAAHAASTSERAVTPLGMCTLAGSMSTCAKRFSHMKRWYA